MFTVSIDDVDVVSRKPSSDSGLDRNDSLDNLNVALTSSTVTDLNSLSNKVANWLLDPRLFAKERSVSMCVPCLHNDIYGTSCSVVCTLVLIMIFMAPLAVLCVPWFS